MSLNAIALLVFPALLVMSLYIIHYGQSPTASRKQANQRIKRYAIGIFLGWFASVTAIVALLASVLSDNCQYAGQILETCILNSGDLLQVSLVLGMIALMALIPTAILYIGLHLFHHFYVGYDKPKGKPKYKKQNEQTVG